MREEDHTLDELVFLPNSKSVIFHDVILLFYCVVHFAHIGNFENCAVFVAARIPMGRLCFHRCLSVHRGGSGERREVPLVTDPWTQDRGTLSPLDRTRHGQEDFLILKNKVV